ncbi:MAG: PepSY domain-containing protein [Sphingobacteriaceae bacterium]|nr:MAG: PepSY domain-containing protein [Sphingobacteriaceae bacterium]
MFKKVNNWLHLWLGLISGIIVFIVCITGCTWVFNEEINQLLEPETRIEKQNKPILMPSQLQQVALSVYPELRPAYVNYQQDRTVSVYLREKVKDKDKKKRGRGDGATIKINPYTGEVVAKQLHKKDETEFFSWVLNGHRFLWLPYEIGRPIVNYSVLIFVVILITGLIWWWPKKWNRSTREKSFSIKWGASFKRVNLDLHNVLGFYAMLFLLAIALTGMVWGIEWYSKSMYWATTGGKTLPEWKEIQSDSLQANKLYKPEQAIDKAFKTVLAKHAQAGGFYYNFPDTSKIKSTIGITVYPDKEQFYNNQSYTFDQHTLKQLKGNEMEEASFDQASFGDKLRRMNYDIHVGSILGFPGKVMAFLSSLIGASLPVTGFLVWWGRKFGKNKKGKIKGSEKQQEDIMISPVVKKFTPRYAQQKQASPLLQSTGIRIDKTVKI